METKTSKLGTIVGVVIFAAVLLAFANYVSQNGWQTEPAFSVVTPRQYRQYVAATPTRQQRTTQSPAVHRQAEKQKTVIEATAKADVKPAAQSTPTTKQWANDATKTGKGK